MNNQSPSLGGSLNPNSAGQNAQGIPGVQANQAMMNQAAMKHQQQYTYQRLGVPGGVPGQSAQPG